MKRLPPHPLTPVLPTGPLSAKQLYQRDPRRAEALAAALSEKFPVAIVRPTGMNRFRPTVRRGFKCVPAELALRIDDARHVIAVKDYAEASGIVAELREQHMEMGMGNSTFPQMTIVDLATGKTVAHVSWNGKVWPGEQWTPDAKPLYEPGRGLPMA